ncbi:MAG: hypothetical protein ACP5OP_09045, partial [Leptospirillia bacterium]
PQLDLGDVVENISPILSAGTYHLQGLISDTGISQNTPVSSPGSVSPPSPFDDSSVTVSSSGVVSSKDGAVSGQIYGNYLSLTVSTGGSRYNFQGKVGILPSSFLSEGTGYSLRTAGPDGSGNLVKLDAVLVPQNATPAWGGISGSSEDGTVCSNSEFGFRIHGLGPLVGGYTYSLCGTVANASPFFTVINGGSGEDDITPSSSVSLSSTISMSTLVNGSTSYPYILTASSVPLASQTGNLYYVMGANEFILSFTASGQEYDTAFLMNENPLDKLSEVSQGSDH